MSTPDGDLADRPSGEEPPENPTDEELDVEGPNESAPGHEPADEDPEPGGEAPPASA